MQFSISTRWNAFRHDDGERLGAEILTLGLSRVELGYDTRPELVPGLKAMFRRGELTCSSVHNFCPVPTGAPQGHPELFSLSSRNETERGLAVRYSQMTIEFAAELGVRIVIAHAGNVAMRPLTRKLIAMHVKDRQDSPGYQRLRLKLIARRQRLAPPHLEALYRSLDALLPVLVSSGTTLALENLPSGEAIPTTGEMSEILRRFAGSPIRCWHDIGHGRILQNLGLEPHLFSLRKLAPHTVGLHIHDVMPPASDHRMPPRGEVPFAQFAGIAGNIVNLVIEPSPDTPACDIVTAMALLTDTWSPR